MGELRIEQHQTKNTQQQNRKQPKKQDNIVIEFSSLPEELKSKEVRELYDKDGSGFIEQCNSKGVDEFSLMAGFASSMGIELSKYKSNIVRTRITDENDYFDADKITIAYDDKGKIVKRLAIEDSQQRVLTEEHNNGYTVLNYYDNDDYFAHATQKSKANMTKLTSTKNFRSGESTFVDYDKKQSTLKDKEGNIVAYGDWKNSTAEKQSRYKYENLTLGKNNIRVVNEYSGIATDDNRLCSIQFNSNYDVSKFYNIPETFELTNTKYYLNGEEVNVNMIDNNTFEIVDENGERYKITK